MTRRRSFIIAVIVISILLTWGMAFAAATRTVVAASSDAEAKRRIAEAASNPVVITLEWLKRWSGGCTTACGGEVVSVMPVLPSVLPTPMLAPVP